MIEVGFFNVAAALVLIVLAIILSRWHKVGTEKELAIGTIRSFVQLVAVGYALDFIFSLENMFAVMGVILIMILVGSHTAASRVKVLEKSYSMAFVSITLGSVVTIGLLMAVGVIKPKAQYMIPLAGMTVGNAMNCAALVMERLHSDITGNRLAIETALSLGKTWRQAAAPFFRKAVKAGMMQMLNFFKVVGIVQLPGAMTGMILAGASPLEAALIQVIVGYMITSAVTITGLTVAYLAMQRMFTPADQLAV